MRKLEVGEAFLQLFPEPPGPKIASPLLGIMQQNYALPAQLGEPYCEVVPNSLVSVIAVDVKQVNLAIPKKLNSSVECRLDQRGEVSIERIMIFLEVLQHLRSVETRMGITFPCVDSVAAGLSPLLHHCLTKRAVGIAGVRPELYQDAGAKRT